MLTVLLSYASISRKRSRRRYAPTSANETKKYLDRVILACTAVLCDGDTRLDGYAFIVTVHAIASALLEQVVSMTCHERALMCSLEVHFADICLAIQNTTPASGSWQLAGGMPDSNSDFKVHEYVRSRTRRDGTLISERIAS